ncbi:MAG: hypothetical protein DLM64_14435 [Solirubrobacterales bacterium]|nr:MAG: hypothetical protein DLM64_14435 [Solirubrobacterales bacterium]
MVAKDAVLIAAYRDGPLLVRGRFELLDAHGQAIECQHCPVALCRCGKSRIRPFCDGTHKLGGFRAPAEDSRLKRSESTGQNQARASGPITNLSDGLARASDGYQLAAT